MYYEVCKYNFYDLVQITYKFSEKSYKSDLAYLPRAVGRSENLGMPVVIVWT